MLIVDTYNALHVTGVLPPDLAGVDVSGLAELVLRSRWGGGPVRLVCDGAKRPGSSGGEAARGRRAARGPGGQIEIVYAGAGKDADSLIERLIQRDSAPRRLVVVSSDSRIRGAARRRKARWLSSEVFLAQLVADQTRPRARPTPTVRPAVPLGEAAVELWMEEFGVTGLDVPAAGDVARPAPFVEAAKGGRLERPEGRRVKGAAGAAPGTDVARLLRAIHEEWGDRLEADDLDMSTWLARYGNTPPPDSAGSPPAR